jgi:hypothetical protein
MTLAAAWIALLLAQAPGASIEGVVLRAGTNDPIAGAQVGVGNSPRITSDQAGRFSIKDLRAGSYTLSVLSNGYARHLYGERYPGGPGAPITLTQGQALNVTIPMAPAGNVNGRIRSADGRPISGITVRLVRRAYNSSGRRTFDTVASARSDDRGAYRFYWTTPGRYYVMAGLPTQGSLRENSDNPNENVENYPYTFFPGSTEFEKAVAIDVRPGAEVDGIDFPLADARLYRIHARVIDPATGQPPPRATASISYWSVNGGGSSSGGDRYDPKTGTMLFKDVMPGAYSVGIVAAGFSNAVISRSTPDGSAGADVVVFDADVDLGLLRLEPPNVITGRITGDPLSPDATPANDFEVSLVRDLTAGAIDPSGRGVQARPQADGSFTVNFSYPSLRATMFRLPPGFYVREAKLDGVDALTGYARVSHFSDLEIVVSSKAAQVEGITRDDRGQPAAGVRVVLVPDVGRSYPERFKEVVTDQNGRFTLSSIPPGDYKVFSWESLEPFGYFDPDLLRRHEQRGRPVHLVESSRETVDLIMIPGGVD